MVSFAKRITIYVNLRLELSCFFAQNLDHLFNSIGITIRLQKLSRSILWLSGNITMTANNMHDAILFYSFVCSQLPL